MNICTFCGTDEHVILRNVNGREVLVSCEVCEEEEEPSMRLADAINPHNTTESYECGCNHTGMELCVAGSFMNGGLTLSEVEERGYTLDGIRVAGHKGKWYVIDGVSRDGEMFYLLEHETYGEDADHICIDDHGRLVFDGITGGVTEISERLHEMEEGNA